MKMASVRNLTGNYLHLIPDAMYQIIYDTLSHHEKRLSSFIIQEGHTKYTDHGWPCLSFTLFKLR